MKFALILFLLASIVCSALSMDDEWEEFKEKFHKKYSSEEEVKRRNEWSKNRMLIDKHNEEADAGLHTFWVKMNEFGDLDKVEFGKLYTGLDLSLDMYTEPVGTFKFDENRVVPESIDWRKKGYVTKVKDQGKPSECGSCWAFAAVGALEGQYFRKTGYLVDFSAQHLVDCTNNNKYSNKGCNGGTMINAFTYIRDNKGITAQANYPYTANRNDECKSNPSELVAAINGHNDTFPNDEKTLKQAVGTEGPVAVMIDAQWSEFQFYSRGVFSMKKCFRKFTHAILVIGYGTDSGDYWLIKNSWGTGWGMNGYAKMARNQKNSCGIASVASYPLVI